MEELTSQPVEVKKVGRPAKQTVEVNKDALDALIASVKEQKEQIASLMYAADKNRLAQFHKANENHALRNCQITEHEGKIVVGWRTLENEVYKDMGGIWHERQIVEITDEDGKKHEMSYHDFGRLKKIMAEIVSRTTNETTGITTFNLKTADGKEIALDSTFIN